uniref:Membrane-associated tyrosine- and threonine-specific cdc2-inhibitory kinase n=1 Tax=Romanomermis culicivorax TaxID=13658 RepID=A0A915L2G0_ROMCU
MLNSIYQSNLSCCYYDTSVDQSYFKQCFIIEEELGSGSFGQVFKVRSKIDGKLYAVKKSLNQFRGAVDRAEKLDEVKKHEQLPHHPNLVRFIRAWEEKGWLYIQTELCKDSLNKYADKYHDFPESTIKNYLVDLLLAVKHLHDHDLIHLDIKPENIFIAYSGVLKLGDFGLVTDLSAITSGTKTIPEGDCKYLAPELLTDAPVGKHVDIFSLGITILELACDLELPSQDDKWQLLRSGRLPEEQIYGFENLSDDLKEIIRRMMDSDWSSRPSADDLLNHPYIKHAAEIRRQREERRQIFNAYTKMTDLLASAKLVFYAYNAFFKSRQVASPFSALVCRTVSSLHQSSSQHPVHITKSSLVNKIHSFTNNNNNNVTSTVSRFKRKNLHNLSFSSGGKRKLTSINSSPIVALRNEQSGGLETGNLSGAIFSEDEGDDDDDGDLRPLPLPKLDLSEDGKF